MIILRHETDDGVEFFTLYGHLSRESLDGLTSGAPSRRASRSRRSARRRERRLDAASASAGHHRPARTRHRFPGRRAADAARAWVALCPDPNLLVAHSARPLSRSRRRRRRRRWRRARARSAAISSIAYRDPVKIVRGWMQYLYDDEGRRYHRRVQQRAARRPLSSARRRSRRARRCACSTRTRAI